MAKELKAEPYEVIEISVSNRKWNTKPEIKKDWECPICKQIMRKAVQLNGIAAHTFCKDCIEIWFNNNKTNPLTGEDIDPDNYTLIENDEINQEIEDLFKECRKMQRTGYWGAADDCMTGPIKWYKSRAAKNAQEFYDENLQHLAGEFELTPWVKEKLNQVREWPFPSNDQDQKEESLSRIDDLEKEMHGYVTDRFQQARQEVKEANPNDIPQIEQELNEDIGCFKKVLDKIGWFFKKIWSVITWPFRKLGQLARWLFGWDQNEGNESNEVNIPLHIQP